MSELKQSLERAEEELGHVKKQLEDKQGMSKPFDKLSANEKLCLMKILVLCAPGANAEIEALKNVVAEADRMAAAEQALREKHEARALKLSESFRRL